MSFWRVNDFAQLCNECGQVVSTFAGAFHTLPSGVHLAYHIACIPPPKEPLMRVTDIYKKPKL